MKTKEAPTRKPVQGTGEWLTSYYVNAKVKDETSGEWVQEEQPRHACTCGYKGEDGNHECEETEFFELHGLLFDLSTSQERVMCSVVLHDRVQIAAHTYVYKLDECYFDRDCFLGTEDAPIKVWVKWFNYLQNKDDFKPMYIRPESIKSIDRIAEVYRSEEVH